MKISSKLIAICLLLGAEKAVKATELSSEAIAEIMSFNNISMQADPTAKVTAVPSVTQDESKLANEGEHDDDEDEDANDQNDEEDDEEEQQNNEDSVVVTPPKAEVAQPTPVVAQPTSVVASPTPVVVPPTPVVKPPPPVVAPPTSEVAPPTPVVVPPTPVVKPLPPVVAPPTSVVAPPAHITTPAEAAAEKKVIEHAGKALKEAESDDKENAEAEAVIRNNEANSATPVDVVAPTATPVVVTKQPKVITTRKVVAPVVVPDEGPKIVVKKQEDKKEVQKPVPAEAAAPGAKVIEQKEVVTTVEDANKIPVEETKAPGEVEAENKPQPKGDAMELKPKTVVVAEADGRKVVTVPEVKVTPVPVEPAEPVILKKDVDLKDKKLETELNVQNKVKTIENKKAHEAQDVTKKASVATAGDISGIEETNENFRSGMTLYHWQMFDQDTQLQMYKASVYKGNMLEDQTQRSKVAIKLTEEETAKIQATLAKKLAQIKQLAAEVIQNLDESDLEPQEAQALEELKKRGFSKQMNHLQTE